VRSSEFARLAGVTVRTLRHYHQVGLLAEPRRRANGYREYDDADLVRVLRIRALAELGLPLDRIPPVLSDAGDDPKAMLDALDADLAEQIEGLTRQRERVAALRTHGVPPDTPAELAPFFAALSDAGLSPESTRSDRDHALVVSRLAGDEGLEQLAHLYRQLSAPAVVDEMTALSEELDRVGPEHAEADVDALVEGLVDVLRIVRDGLVADGPEGGLTRAQSFVDANSLAAHNPTQQRVLDRVREALAADVPRP
jgi:DNA-binding transcriptional MerR regulator